MLKRSLTVGLLLVLSACGDTELQPLPAESSESTTLYFASEHANKRIRVTVREGETDNITVLLSKGYRQYVPQGRVGADPYHRDPATQYCLIDKISSSQNEQISCKTRPNGSWITQL